MSKTNVRRPQKKSTLKKRQDWDTSLGDLSQHRLSDDEAVRRKQSYQSRNLQLIQEEKQRKLLAKAVHDARKNNSNQLGILREILFNERDVDELMQRSSNVLQTSRSDKVIPKSSILRSGKNHFTSLNDNRARKTSSTSTSRRPSGIRNLNSPGGADWNQSEEDNLSVSSADGGDGEEDELENEPVRLSRTNRKTDQQNGSSNIHLLNDREQHPTTRNPNLYSQSRQQQQQQQQQPNGIRSINNVSFMSDVSKTGGKTIGIESTNNSSASQLKMLLDRLSSELNDLESITGFKPDKTNSSLNNQSNTCSTALVTALIGLTGHVKQCALSSKGQPIQETNTLKDQLSVVIKAQLDFQQKIENQISMLQTMMQTVCQLVNNEIISNKKPSSGNSTSQSTINSARSRRDQTDFQISEPRQNWLNNNNNNSLQKPKTNSADELLTFTQRMSSITPTDSNQYRYSTYNETNEISKKFSRPTSAISTNENDFSRQILPRRNIDQESRSSMISPIDTPSSYDLFESGLPKSNSTTSMIRSTTGTSTTNNETILEKILQERLLLVQQIAELNKQHEMTQEELANLEANTLQQRIT